MMNFRINLGFNSTKDIRRLLLLVAILCSSPVYGYSNVRRTGSTAAIEELRNQIKETPVVSPMIRPSNQSPPLKYYVDQDPVPIRRLDDQIDHPNNVAFRVENGRYVVEGERQVRREDEISKEDLSTAFEIVKQDIENEEQSGDKVTKLEQELLTYVDESLSKDNYEIFSGVKIEPVDSLLDRNITFIPSHGSPRLARSIQGMGFDDQVLSKFEKYARNHVLTVNLPRAARFFMFKFPQGNTFMTGFMLGFLAFGLKKLLLPIFLGAQVVKSILIAMFLPSILGSVGKIIGKGLSQFSGSSANFGINHDQMEQMDLDFKDQTGYGTEQDPYTYPNSDTIGTINANQLYGGDQDVAMSRFGPGGVKVTYLPSNSGNYYRSPYRKQEDYKVFHNIPASSMLLSNYDPFYSPLLSRLDSVFQRLGMVEGSGSLVAGSGTQEKCREKLICLMYATPAKYAPYSNLVSAQLSRELNELRKPTSDNPEILRFFRYMKAAKDGQEGIDCNRYYGGCPRLSAETGTAAMITTYNDINKLVSARKLI